MHRKSKSKSRSKRKNKGKGREGDGDGEDEEDEEGTKGWLSWLLGVGGVDSAGRGAAEGGVGIREERAWGGMHHMATGGPMAGREGDGWGV